MPKAFTKRWKLGKTCRLLGLTADRNRNLEKIAKSQDLQASSEERGLPPGMEKRMERRQKGEPWTHPGGS